MLIVLPPSEGKRIPRRGRPLDPSSLSFPELAPTRERVMTALERLCSGPAGVAAETLGLGPTQWADLEENTTLRTRPTATAISVYSGVLYDALDYPTLTAQARRRAQRQVAIASGLWGLLRPLDRIPAYRLSGAVALPGLGTLASAWRGPIAQLLADSTGLVVDMRSGVYSALGPVPREAADRSVAVRVLLERDGRRSVVSHMNKATKGRALRTILEAPSAPRSSDDLADTLRDSGFTTELARSSTAPDVIDLVVEAV